MFQREAAWIAGELAALADAEVSPLLNLGSSSGAFRTEEQPWIERDLFQPLAARGVRVVHCDVKDQPGVDLVADLLDPAGRAAAAAVEPRAILCSNLLEHVPDPAAMLDACLDILPPGGVLIVTVPKSYPHHRDPIDTMYRPTPDQVFALIGERASRISAAVLEPGSYRDDLRRRPWLLLRPLLRLPAPFLGLDKWKRSLGKLYWVFHPYQVTCLVARKT